MFTSRKILRDKKQRAFTLVEVMLALTILMLLVGVIYAMVDGTNRGASELQTQEGRNQEIGGFLSLCRKAFRTMPATVLFSARTVPQGDGYNTELIFRNAPGLMAWGDAKNSFDSTILGARGQVGGFTGLGILQDAESEISAYLNGGTAASRQWMVLLPDLRKAQWRFYDARSSTWREEWSDTAIRPAFVELTLTTEEGAGKYIFWLPPVVKNQQG